MADTATTPPVDSPITVYNKRGESIPVKPNALEEAITKGWMRERPVNPMKELKEVPKPMAPEKVAA